jgi:uncharacterized membrane protein YhaH (DUF805 family)
MTILRWLFSFHGRVGRQVYFLGSFILGAISYVMLWVLELVIKSLHASPVGHYVFLTIWSVSTAIQTYSISCLMVKRLHDIGRSGIWALGAISAVMLYEYIGLGLTMFPPDSGWLFLFVFSLVLLLYPGEEKDNAYGPAHAR